MSDKGNANRRNFFRIVDSLGVAYRVIADDQAGLGDDEQGSFIDTYSLMNNFNAIIHTSLEDLSTRDPSTAAAIEALNKKVDAILAMMELDSLLTQRIPHRVEQASISASGIAFPVEECLAPGTSLMLDLLLKPSSQHITALGKVISCESLKQDEHHYLRVEFTEMNDKDRETLIQHIVQRQGVLLRSLKHEEDDT